MTNTSSNQIGSPVGVVSGMSALAVMDQLRRTGMKLWADSVKLNANATQLTAAAAQGAAKSTIAAGEAEKGLMMAGVISSSLGAAGGLASMGTAYKSWKVGNEADGLAKARDNMELARKNIPLTNANGNPLPEPRSVADIRKAMGQPGGSLQPGEELHAQKAHQELTREAKGAYLAAQRWTGTGDQFSGALQNTGKAVDNGLSMQLKIEKARDDANSQLFQSNQQMGKTQIDTAQATMSGNQKLLDSSTDSMAEILRALNMKG